MKRVFLIVLFCISANSWAAKLTCSDDTNTNEYLCYNDKDVKANGDLRAVKLYKGGPKGVNDTGFLAVLNCKIGYLEMRDRQGVTFARDQPEKLHVIKYRDMICEEKNPRVDKTLK